MYTIYMNLLEVWIMDKISTISKKISPKKKENLAPNAKTIMAITKERLNIKISHITFSSTL